MKKILSSLFTLILVITMTVAQVGALEVQSTFVQNTQTANTYGFVDYETDAFEVYSDAEGGIDGNSNNYSQIAANRLAVTYTNDDMQSAF